MSDPDSLPQLREQRARADADLDRSVELTRAVARQRSRLLLLRIALELAVEAPAATIFAIHPSSSVPTRWQISGFFNAEGEAAEVRVLTKLRIGRLMSANPLTFHPGLVPPDASVKLHPWPSSWHIPVASMIDHVSRDTLPVVDMRQLTEEDYAFVDQVARERLGAVGVVRTRGDFAEQIRDSEELREDASEEQIGLAAEAARLRYKAALEEIGFSSQVSPQLFFDSVHEAIDSFGLSDDVSPHDPRSGLADGRRPSGRDL